MSIGKFDTKNVTKQTTILLWCSFFLTVVMGFWAFVVPPKGIIDESVLKLSTILFGFAPVSVVREAIKEGIGVKMRHGETEIEVNNDNTEDKYGRCN